LAFSFYPPISRIVKSLNLDLIHSHQPFSIGKDGWRQARRNDLPIVFTHHCRYEDYTHYVPIIPQQTLKWHVKKRATIFANQCDRVIAPSQTIKRIIEQRGVRKKIEVLPTGLDWKKFQKGAREAKRHELGLSKNEIALLFVGRLEKEKNIEFIMETVVYLLKKFDNLRLIIVGEGSLRMYCQKYLRKQRLETRGNLVGLVSQAEIQDYYAAGDIFLHASITETQGVTINEAMAAGLPIVAVRSSGISDAISAGRTGILTEEKQTAFREAIASLIKDSSKRRALGKMAREEARNWSYQKQAEKLEKIYEQVLAEKHKE